MRWNWDVVGTLGGVDEGEGWAEGEGVDHNLQLIPLCNRLDVFQSMCCLQ